MPIISPPPALLFATPLSGICPRQCFFLSVLKGPIFLEGKATPPYDPWIQECGGSKHTGVGGGVDWYLQFYSIPWFFLRSLFFKSGFPPTHYLLCFHRFSAVAYMFHTCFIASQDYRARPFPLSMIVGCEEIKTALLLAAVNPKIGGCAPFRRFLQQYFVFLCSLIRNVFLNPFSILLNLPFKFLGSSFVPRISRSKSN